MIDKVRSKPIPTGVSLFLLILVAGLVYFLPPTSPALIFLFIALVTALTFLVTSIFFSKKYGYLATSFVLLFLGVSYLVGFQLQTTFLLLCFIIGIGILIKK